MYEAGEPNTVEVPDDVLALLKLREGFRAKSYGDSLGKLTGGYGHLLSASEKNLYPVGTPIPNDVADSWFASDSLSAYRVAICQAWQIGCDNPILVEALTAVCFQLGINWELEFNTLWSLLKSQQWEAAAEDAEGTAWAKETPVRVQDFARALRSLIPAPTNNGDAN